MSGETVASAAGPLGEQRAAEQGKKRLENMACLQIALGILGVLLLILPVTTSLHHWLLLLAEFGLLLGVVLPAVGGFMGFKEERQARAKMLMTAGNVILAIAVIALLIGSGNGLISWDFPLGAIFLVLAVFSWVATRRFGKHARSIHLT